MISNSQKIAVLMTCHNRREKSLMCLSSLYGQKITSDITFTVFLTDDGCTDGTAEAIKNEFPEVVILRGNGSLFWCGGMRNSWMATLSSNSDKFDMFLWLNDDVVLVPGALSEMVITLRKSFGIVVGSCADPDTGRWTYGGRASESAKKSLKGVPVIPSDQVQRCQLMNGNIVLIPSKVVEHIGILSDKYTHTMGDYDYGLRAIEAGIPLLVARNYQGFCSANALPDWCNPAIPLKKRLSFFNGPKGIHYSEFMVFAKTHFGFKAIIIGLKVVIRVLVPSLWCKYR